MSVFLEFQFRKARMIDLGDARHYTMKMTMTEQDTPRGKATVPSFDFSTVLRVELKDERPKLPKKPAGMSEGYFEKLCDAAYEKSARSKAFNDNIRDRVAAYVNAGVIEVTLDPFAGNYEYEGTDPELVEAISVAPAPEAEGEILLPSNGALDSENALKKPLTKSKK